MIKLSDRLLSVAELVTPGLIVADIGTDHGYLPIYLMQNKLAKSVIASDVNVGPLQKAVDNIKMHGLNDLIDTRLSDGLKMFEEGEVESIVMAGMGGNLIIEIIINSLEICRSAKEMILQPQSDIGRVRHYLNDNGFMIISENMVCEDGKFYPMMKVKNGNQRWEHEFYYEYGKILLRERNPVLHEFLILEKNHLCELYQGLACADQTQHVRDRMEGILMELYLNKQGLDCIEEGNPVEIDRVIE